MVSVGLLPARAALEAMDGPARTYAAALRTVYQPQGRYDGVVRLVLAQDPALDSAGNQREQGLMIEGWRGQGGGLEVWYGGGITLRCSRRRMFWGWPGGGWKLLGLGRWCLEGCAPIQMRALACLR